ncbi:MAG TPA: LuxR C-terminal-related transcriptional regulator [Polyangiaceae bacterium]|nr:LuxR C-terminal-related transcriptional regulator [Polyangiaceae bacterium]
MKRRVLVIECEGSDAVVGVAKALIDRELELVVCRDLNVMVSSADLAIFDADRGECDLRLALGLHGSIGGHPKLALLTSNYTGVNVARLARHCDIVLPKPLDVAALVGLVQWLLQRVDPVTQFLREHRLSPRESSLLKLSLSGWNNHQIAESFGCSRATISTYWNRVFRKTGVNGQREVLSLLFNRLHNNCGGLPQSSGATSVSAERL